MYIEHLSLKNFRNYENEEFSFIPGTNILYGQNAQGKTNVLEALYFFSIGKSFRTPQDRELIWFGADFSRAELTFSDRKRSQKIEIILRRDRKKQIKVGGVVIQKLSELVGTLQVVLFCPEELSLVKEGPYVRRRFIDIALSQLRPNYYRLLSSYHKVLEQRNHLIKKIKFQGNTALSDTMSVWDEKLSEYGVEIVRYRSDFIGKLEGFAQKVHAEICPETLGIEYRTRVTTKEDFLEKLSSGIERELEQGCTLFGPHRDDILLTVDGREAKTFASQGQQRTIVLALKLAQADLLFEETGEYPILLLDDIMSELDAGRRAYLAKKIQDKQVIITCTDVEPNLSAGQTKTIHIENGRII